MKNKYFSNPKNRAELRKEYLKLLKKYHPDNGGSDEECKTLNAEYERLFKILPAASSDEEPETSKEAEKKAAADLDKAIRDVLQKIIHFEDINIEIIGTWVWVDGLTFPIKEELKAAGFIWSKARKKWHYAPYGERVFYKGRGKRPDFESIRRRYGSEEVETEKQKKLA